MKTIKISCADSTKSWSNNRNPMIFKFLPNRGNIWKNCQFFWNDESIKKADYWVIIADFKIIENDEVALCSKEELWLIKVKKSGIFLLQTYIIISTKSRRTFLQKLQKSLSKKLLKIMNYFGDLFFLIKFKIEK